MGVRAQGPYARQHRELDDLCNDCGGGLQPASTLNDVRVVAKKTTQGNTKYRGDFELSPDVKIPVWVYARVAEEKFPSLKKVVLNDDAEVDEEGARHYANTSMDRQYKSLTDDDQILRPEAMVKGFKYGRDKVPFSKVDEEVLKYTASKCLTLLCFVPQDEIPRHVYTEGVDWLCPPGKAGEERAEKDIRAARALNALAHAMFEERKVAIVRFVKREKSSPSLAAVFATQVDTDVDDERFDDEEDGASASVTPAPSLPPCAKLILASLPSRLQALTRARGCAGLGGVGRRRRNGEAQARTVPPVPVLPAVPGGPPRCALRADAGQAGADDGTAQCDGRADRRDEPRRCEEGAGRAGA